MIISIFTTRNFIRIKPITRIIIRRDNSDWGLTLDFSHSKSTANSLSGMMSIIGVVNECMVALSLALFRRISLAPCAVVARRLSASVALPIRARLNARTQTLG